MAICYEESFFSKFLSDLKTHVMMLNVHIS